MQDKGARIATPALDISVLRRQKREKHVGGRLPPTEDKKDANKLSAVREKPVLIESRLETRG
jgi:hypothetical protein